MSLTEIVKAMQQQAAAQRKEESELLQSIKELSDIETAEAAAELYAAEKHAYSFDGYLYQLERLKTVMEAGVPAKTAMELVDSCLDTRLIIRAYHMAQAGGYNE